MSESQESTLGVIEKGRNILLSEIFASIELDKMHDFYNRLKEVDFPFKLFVRLHKDKIKQFSKEEQRRRCDEWRNLPETEDILKNMRQDLDSEATERWGLSGNNMGQQFEELLFEKERTALGLDIDSLTDEFDRYSEYTGKKSPDLYLPILSLIHKLFGERLEGKTIVEVGCGEHGMFILQYLASKGAKVIAVDLNDQGESIKQQCPNVQFAQGAWEDIAVLIPKDSVDFIYTHYMYPNPQQGGKYNDNKDKFEVVVQEGMDNVLKPAGFYVQHSMETDFVLNTEEFKRKGYLEVNVYPPKIGDVRPTDTGDSNVSERAKDRFGKIYRFGRLIGIDQKPLK